MAFLNYSITLALLSAMALSFSTEPSCEELTKPLVLDSDNSSIFMGKWILDEGASEGIVGMIIQTMDTHWMEVSPGTKNDTVRVRQAYRLDNTCRYGTVEIPLKNNHFYVHANEAEIQYYLLPACSNCLTGYFSQKDKEYPTRVLLLFSRERLVSDKVRALYRKQVECLGFPNLITSYNDESELCPEEANEAKEEQN